MDANLHLENMIQIGLTDKEIDLAMCDKEEIRYPASIMPHGTCIVLHKHTRKPIAVAANFDDILNVKNEKDENFLSILPESFWYDLERHKKGYLGRYLLKNNVVVDIVANPKNHKLIIDIERFDEKEVFSNSIAAIDEINNSVEKLGKCKTEQSLIDCLVHELFNLTGYDKVQYLIMHDDGTLQTIAETQNNI